MNSSKGALLESLKILFSSGEYSDLTITCEDNTYHVHKSLICPRSKFFQKACKFQAGKEAAEGNIDLPDDDPEMVKRMIQYFYLGDYEPTTTTDIEDIGKSCCTCAGDNHQTSKFHIPLPYPWEIDDDAPFEQQHCACHCIILKQNSAGEPPKEPCRVKQVQILEPLTIHASMYSLADKYMIPDLMDAAIDKFRNSLHFHWNSEDFVNAVVLAYSTTPESNRGLRDMIVQAFRKYLKFNLWKHPEIESRLHEFDELTFLCLKLRMSEMEQGWIERPY